MLCRGLGARRTFERKSGAWDARPAGEKIFLKHAAYLGKRWESWAGTSEDRAGSPVPCSLSGLRRQSPTRFSIKKLGERGLGTETPPKQAECG